MLSWIIKRRIALLVAATAIALASFGAATCWIAFPARENLVLQPPLRPWAATDRGSVQQRYAGELAPLRAAFRPEAYRSFCGPASLATILRASGIGNADQRTIFPRFSWGLRVFYSGMSLAQLDRLAQAVGFTAQVVYVDSLSLEQFRDRLKASLDGARGYVLVNDDRRVLHQSGIGHISPIGAYDEERDLFLVLDEASYHYPFTWIPAQMLYDASHTRDGDHFRGLLFIQAHRDSQ
jgi:hypothetical protein